MEQELRYLGTLEMKLAHVTILLEMSHLTRGLLPNLKDTKSRYCWTSTIVFEKFFRPSQVIEAWKRSPTLQSTSAQ